MEENLAIDGRGNNVAIAGMCSSFFYRNKEREKRTSKCSMFVACGVKLEDSLIVLLVVY